MKTKTIAMICLLPLVIWPPVAHAIEITFEWTAPTTGSPVDHYVFQMDLGEGFVTIDNNVEVREILIDMPEGTTLARVAGVDEFDRQGPWSNTVTFTDNGPPGGCALLRRAR